MSLFLMLLDKKKVKRARSKKPNQFSKLTDDIAWQQKKSSARACNGTERKLTARGMGMSFVGRNSLIGLYSYVAYPSFSRHIGAPRGRGWISLKAIEYHTIASRSSHMWCAAFQLTKHYCLDISKACLVLLEELIRRISCDLYTIFS